MNNTYQNNSVSKNEDSKKILTLIVLIGVFMACTTSATYAFFAISADNDNKVQGEAASVGLSLNVYEKTLGGTSSGATQTGKMVPQLTSALGTAIGENYKCVDANGNTVCKVYQIRIMNTSNSAIRINGTIQFSGVNYEDAGGNAVSSTFKNLYWRKITDSTTLGSNQSVQITNADATPGAISSSSLSKIYDIPAANGTVCNITSSSTGCTRISIPAATSTDIAVNTSYVDYYFVVWISETSASQNTTDVGKWAATIHFEGENGQGVTSTITS